jgi:hypothetical protein
MENIFTDEYFMKKALEAEMAFEKAKTLGLNFHCCYNNTNIGSPH